MSLISAPGSSTGSTPPMNYHVFLSFKGKDTRKNFTDHLYSALLRKGIVTFRDDEELDRGEVISVNLLKAIEESLFAILVLSKNYASSSWCLDELQKIVESKQDLGRTVFPIFYDVDPSDIRHQKGNVGRALKEHEGRFTKDEVQKWREALTKVANLSGWDTRDEHEAKVVEDIAKFVWNKLRVELPSNFEHLVGDIQSKEAKFEVANILNMCGLHPIIGIKLLIEKSLLSCPKSNSNSWVNAKGYLDMHDWLQKIRRDIFLPNSLYNSLLQEIDLKESLYMHDLLQEMGRNIVLQESPSDAGKRSRLWSLKEIDRVLKGNKGTEKVQSVVLDIEQHFEAAWHPDCFSKMHNIRLLDLSNVHLSRILNSLPNALKVLRWDYYALESLPPMDQLYELEGLQLCSSKIRKLWKGTLFLDKLRVINLSDSKDLIETPDFSGTPNLEKMFLNRCKNLVWVHKSLGQLKKLVELSLEDCENLVTLPSYLEMNSLEVFILGGCSKLKKLPEFDENMRSLFFFDVRGTSITKVPSSIIHLTSLKYFDLSYCCRLKSIPEVPPNLIIVADGCPFLEPRLALQHLFASRLSKHPGVLQGPSHLLYDDFYSDFSQYKEIPRWFERREHYRSNGNSGEFVTITAYIPCDIADYKGEWWGIAVSLVFQGIFPTWRGFSINWKFQDYCHTNKRYGISRRDLTDSRLYIGFYPFDKKDSRRHPSGVARKVDLTLFIPRTNDGCTEQFPNELEIVNCGWRLICKKDFHAWSASSIDFNAWWRTRSTNIDAWWSTR